MAPTANADAASAAMTWQTPQIASVPSVVSLPRTNTPCTAHARTVDCCSGVDLACSPSSRRQSGFSSPPLGRPKSPTPSCDLCSRQHRTRQRVQQDSRLQPQHLRVAKVPGNACNGAIRQPVLTAMRLRCFNHDQVHSRQTKLDSSCLPSASCGCFAKRLAAASGAKIGRSMTSSTSL